MKKILLLLVALLTAMTAWAEDYITDVMVIGGSQSVVNNLKDTYTRQGWTVIDQDLNKGCGSSSDYIYLLYKKASEDSASVGAFITNFLISTATGTIPDSFSSSDRTYHLVPFDGSDYFKNNKGDLNSHCGSSSATIHLYFTKEYDPNGKDYSTVKSIAFNDTQAGGVPVADATTGYDLNTGAGGDYNAGVVILFWIFFNELRHTRSGNIGGNQSKLRAFLRHLLHGEVQIGSGISKFLKKSIGFHHFDTLLTCSVSA